MSNIIPKPLVEQRTEGTFYIGHDTEIVMDATCSQDELFAAELLRQAIYEHTNYEFEIRKAFAAPVSKAIFIEKRDIDIDVDIKDGQSLIFIQFRHQISRIWRICIEDVFCLIFYTLLKQHLVSHNRISGLNVSTLFLRYSTKLLVVRTITSHICNLVYCCLDNKYLSLCVRLQCMHHTL